MMTETRRARIQANHQHRRLVHQRKKITVGATSAVIFPADVVPNKRTIYRLRSVSKRIRHERFMHIFNKLSMEAQRELLLLCQILTDTAPFSPDLCAQIADLLSNREHKKVHEMLREIIKEETNKASSIT